MTLAEFKAWFEGFTESMDAAPSKKQWERIKERVGQIDGTVLTREVIYRDRYWPHYVHHWGPYYTNIYGMGSPTLAAQGHNSMMANGNLGMASANQLSAGTLMDLGKADYQSLS